MPGRKIGGGRILGNGKSLAPPAPQHQRTTSLVSPSESTLSSSATSASPHATSPVPDKGHDISSKVSLGNGGHAPEPTVGGSRLLCPICEEEMMTLLQLNRHLDDNHQELPELEQDEIKNWFNRQVLKAKKFQPLAVINQKLKGLDVFESNGVASTSSTPMLVSRVSTPEPHRPDPDELVTRAHWQRTGYGDMCTEPACSKRLGAVNGTVNCRMCGRLFCEDHTMYQMKLSRSAQHEPVRGFWCRVCETCYKSREGYNDHNGLVRDHTDDFMALRRQTVDKAFLEVSRLEKRLTKLTQMLVHPPKDASGNGNLLSLAGQRHQRKMIEQSVVPWEEDVNVKKCPFCQQEFGSWSFRRHHCRLCGRVVCADPKTNCSTEIGLNVQADKKPLDSSNNTAQSVAVDIRMCTTCHTTLFSASDFAASLASIPPSQRAYITLLQFEKGIRRLLPTFHKLLLALQDPDNPPSPAQLAEASKVRKRLIDSFSKYDLAAKRLRDLPTDSPTQERLQKAVYLQSSNFLHLHMLPLKSLPKILRHATPSNGIQGNRSANDKPVKALASIKMQRNGDEMSESSATALSQLESEEKELKERLIVLEEQRFMVQEMMGEAGKRRRFDEVSALRGNLGDLEREIVGVNGELAQLDWGVVYAGGNPKGHGEDGEGATFGDLRGWMGLRGK